MGEQPKPAPAPEKKAAGLDCGTMFLQSCRDGKEGPVYTEIRDCYRIIPNAEEFLDQLKEHKAHYLVKEDNIYILGQDAYIQAGMAEFGAGDRAATAKILHRPMKSGILNPDSPKTAMAVLRELIKHCVEGSIGPARPGEILCFSIPANPVDSRINNTFHARTVERFLKGLNYDARPVGEGLAVIFAENPKMKHPDGDIPFTGIGISLGAGQANFCIAERGMPLDEFSVARSGDWIDENAALMSGQPITKVTRVKEKKLDFGNLDMDDPIILALDCYYSTLIEYVFNLFADRFAESKGSIDHPIEIILSGGTARPKGLDAKIKEIVTKMKLPFEISGIRPAKDMMRAVADGCYLKAKQAAKKT